MKTMTHYQINFDLNQFHNKISQNENEYIVIFILIQINVSDDEIEKELDNVKLLNKKVEFGILDKEKGFHRTVYLI